MKNLKGFTLIELMTIVVIIGVGASFLIPEYKALVEKPNSNECAVSIGDSEYITSPEHCEALRLYIESNIQ